MKIYLDSCILVASLTREAAGHAECDALLARGKNWTTGHALNEAFATLTGGRLGFRVPAERAAALIRESVVPFVSFVELEIADILAAHDAARGRGVRGGAIYDAMHMTAARKCGVDAVCTLNISDFEAVWRPGDPAVAPRSALASRPDL